VIELIPNKSIRLSTAAPIADTLHL
jgi:hypothetical protein